MHDRDLMALRADTDFTYDARGRMLLSNEPCVAARRPAPRAFVGLTRAGHIVRFGTAEPDGLVQHLQAHIEHLPPLDDLQNPPAALDAVRVALERQAPLTAIGGGPVYRFPAQLPPPTGAIRLTAANIDLLRSSYPWLYEELPAWWPCFAAVCDGAAVSVCFSSRLTDGAAEAGVDTLPAFRGHGYATCVTAAWGAAIRASGRIPLYSTGWENVASQGVARRLGLVTFGADTTWM